MVLANLVSAWLGVLFVTGLEVVDADVMTVRPLFLLLVVLAYAITQLVEFPFVAFLFRGEAQWLRRSWRASLMVQSASYLLLAGWFWLVSGTSLLTGPAIVPAAALPLPDGVTVYYIAENGYVYTLDRHMTARRIYDLNNARQSSSLALSASDSTGCSLLATRLEDNQILQTDTVRDTFATRAVPVRNNGGTQRVYGDDLATLRWWGRFGPAAKLGTAEQSRWEVSSGFWGAGLTGRQDGNRQTFEITMETPLGFWRVRNVTHLPEDKVLFQLGELQVCLYDIPSNRLTLLAHGYSPVAVMEITPVVENTGTQAAARRQ